MLRHFLECLGLILAVLDSLGVLSCSRSVPRCCFLLSLGFNQRLEIELDKVFPADQSCLCRAMREAAWLFEKY